jgi:hypothetical protein
MKQLKPYSPENEEQMRNFYNSLNEKSRRHYVALEANKLGFGGISYICRLLNCSEHTVKRGVEELSKPLPSSKDRIRLAGGGRKREIDKQVGIDEAFLEVMKSHTAGSPMDEQVKWSNLSRQAIADKLEEKGGKVSVTVVDQLLTKHNFRRRQAFKSVAGKQVAQRDEQFKNIEQITENAKAAGNPVISMDVKKKN